MIKYLKNTIGSIGLLLISNACTEPFNARSFSFERVIVVDGLITDENKFHQVKLTYTYPIGSNEEEGITNADVRLVDSNGRQVFYEEQDPGIYQSSLAFAGEVGKSYRLTFTTPDGRSYESDNQLLKASPPIDTIYNEYAIINEESLNAQIVGAQFFLDTRDDSRQSSFYRYEWKEDYKIIAPYPSRWEYFAGSDRLERRTESVHICFESETSGEINIGNSVGSSQNRLIAHPIRFVSIDNDKLRFRYALTVTQYSISENAHSFYRKIKESIESGGSLFDEQQGTITGNIRSLDDPFEAVLGYFEVAGVSQKRVFFNFEDLDDRLRRPSFRFDCRLIDLIETPRDSIRFIIGPNSPFRIVDFNEGLGLENPSLVRIGIRNCTDCSWYASTEPPSYWIE